VIATFIAPDAYGRLMDLLAGDLTESGETGA
jgi:hypothetical protein